MKNLSLDKMSSITGGVSGGGCFFVAIGTLASPIVSGIFGGWGYLKQCWNS
jgi:hypothetical protein